MIQILNMLLELKNDVGYYSKDNAISFLCKFVILLDLLYRFLHEIIRVVSRIHKNCL